MPLLRILAVLSLSVDITPVRIWTRAPDPSVTRSQPETRYHERVSRGWLGVNRNCSALVLLDLSRNQGLKVQFRS